MGFFDKLFGKGKEVKPTSSNDKMRQNFFITNASEFGLGDIELSISGQLRIDALLAMAQIEKVFKDRGQVLNFSAMYTTLFEEGALTVPIVFSVGELKYSLYFIYQEQEMLKYLDLIKHISKTSYPNLIYFSSIPIRDHYTPQPIIEPFQLADLRYDRNGKVAGKYAMWWSTEEDPFFHKSKTYEYLSKLNEFMKGYESYMVGYLLRQTRILQEQQLSRIELPDQHVNYVIDGPEEKKIILDLSKENGIRFLFPIDKVSSAYRDRFIKEAMVDFVASLIPLRQGNYPMDETLDTNSYDWFNLMAETVKLKEESLELTNHQIGFINYNAELN